MDGGTAECLGAPPAQLPGTSRRQQWRPTQLAGLALTSPSGGSSSSTAGVVEGRDAPLLVKVLSELHEHLRAYLFLFVEVSCVGSSAAACRPLHSCLWSDVAFWRTYAGPCLFGEPPASSAAHVRDAFRRWLFRLEGDWAEDFGRCVERARQAEFGPDFLRLLADARYIVSGLMPGDGGSSIDAFAEILVALFNEYDPSQLDERSIAEALVSQVELKEDVFTVPHMTSIASAFDQSVERAVLQHGMEERVEVQGYLVGPLEDESEEEDGLPGAAAWEPRAPAPLLLDGDYDTGLESPRDADDEAELSFWRSAAPEEPP